MCITWNIFKRYTIQCQYNVMRNCTLCSENCKKLEGPSNDLNRQINKHEQTSIKNRVCLMRKVYIMEKFHFWSQVHNIRMIYYKRCCTVGCIILYIIIAGFMYTKNHRRRHRHVVAMKGHKLYEGRCRSRVKTMKVSFFCTVRLLLQCTYVKV